MRAATATLALTAFALMAPASTSAQACDSQTDNILTSDDCPERCGTNPCVLYAPSQKCEDQDGGPAGWCYSEIVNTGCNVSYQCLDNLVAANKWTLALTASSRQAKVTTVPVNKIQKISYPSGVNIVQVAGGLGMNVRGDLKNVALDDSFFATPASVTSFYLSEMNLQKALARLDFSNRKWTRVAFNNANLNEVPAGLAKLPLKYVELTKNIISNISDATPFKNVDTLNLAYNNLKDFNIELPALEILNLTGNPLTKIPDSIFAMKNINTLALRQCNLANVVLTESQFAFLQQVTTLDADMVVTSCPSGTIAQTFPTGGGSVCIPGTDPSTVVSESRSSSNSTTMIVVIVVGVVVIALLAAMLLRRKRKQDAPDYVSMDPTKQGGSFATGDGTFTGTTGDSVWNDPDLLAYRIEYRDIEPVKLLARGGFGEVWLGLYMNENVAIKRLLNGKKTMEDALAFSAEIKIMARLDHPKIVRFIGVAWTNALTIQAVTEFMDCGDLRSLLDSSRAPSLTWANLKCQIAIDIADALVYMHTLDPKLIHRDLKSRNVLIDANSGAKLSDFGISRNRSVEETMTAGVGTSRWIAPEVILSGHYTEFADIYSFGVVLSELDTAKTPFHDAVNTNGAKMPDITILQLVSAGKLQPSFEPSCPESIVKLARACLSFDPKDRPSAIHISYELRKIFKDEL